MVVTPEQITRLRRLVGDKLSDAGDDSDTFWKDSELEDILNEANGSMNLAAYKGWQEKAAEYARLIDISESGADRRLSQRHVNATRMVEIFRKNIADGFDSPGKSRVVARVASLDECPISDAVAVPGEIYEVSGDNIRYYPLKRATSILR